jgi:hypothetical protein
VRHAATPSGTGAFARSASTSSAAISPTVRYASWASRARRSSRLARLQRLSTATAPFRRGQPTPAAQSRAGADAVPTWTTGLGGGDWGVWLGEARRRACCTPQRQPASTRVNIQGESEEPATTRAGACQNPDGATGETRWPRTTRC